MTNDLDQRFPNMSENQLSILLEICLFSETKKMCPLIASKATNASPQLFPGRHCHPLWEKLVHLLLVIE